MLKKSCLKRVGLYGDNHVGSLVGRLEWQQVERKGGRDKLGEFGLGGGGGMTSEKHSKKLGHKLEYLNS